MSRAMVEYIGSSETGFGQEAYFLGLRVTYIDPGIAPVGIMTTAEIAYSDSPVVIRTKIGQLARANVPAGFTPVPIGDVTILLTVSKD